MKIFPHHQFRPRYLGEATVYDLLTNVFDENGFAVHSLNLPEHEYKRWGEADFIIVNPEGVILLEIKGGIVSLAGRVWRYENARGQAIESAEGPAKQAISAAVALEKLLTAQLGRKVRCRWGVVFPLCSFNRSLVELPRNRLADSHVCQDAQIFSEWLQNIPFDQHNSADFALTPTEVEEIRQIILPELSAVTSLALSIRSLQYELIRLTEQQFSILESLASNQRICVTGGAGTGKTELAMLSARAEKIAGYKPVIVTAGKVLSLALKKRMAEFDIPVVSHRLPYGANTLIVDEGQDFAHPQKMQSLFDQLPGGMTEGRWRWFMDPNLQFMEYRPDPICLKSIAASSTGVELNRNVRSTSEIVSTIKVFLEADIGTSQIDGYGIRVGFHTVQNLDDEVQSVVRLVYDLLESGIQPSEIAILGAANLDGPVCSRLIKILSETFLPISQSGRISSTNHGLICDIFDFRGMESRVVFLVDLNSLQLRNHGESLLYIGMSRASASLQLMVTPGFRKFLKTLAKINFERN